MPPITLLDEQIRQTLTDLGAFDATCPGCGHGYAFRTTPRLRGAAPPWSGQTQEVPVLLPCTHCSYVAEHAVAVTWPVPERAKAA